MWCDATCCDVIDEMWHNAMMRFDSFFIIIKTIFNQESSTHQGDFQGDFDVT